MNVVLTQIQIYSWELINTYSTKQADLYYFETIKMMSQAWSKFVWRIQTAGKYSL